MTLLKVFSEDDANCRQREEADSVEHWEDDRGASGIRVLAKGFSVAFVDNSAKRLSVNTSTEE
jgi:hypothetical protein